MSNLERFALGYLAIGMSGLVLDAHAHPTDLLTGLSTLCEWAALIGSGSWLMLTALYRGWIK